MMFQQSFYAAEGGITAIFEMQVNATLLAVSAAATSKGSGKVSVLRGEEKLLIDGALGTGGNPLGFGRSDFTGSQFPRILRGDVLTVKVESVGKTVIKDATVVLTFTV